MLSDNIARPKQSPNFLVKFLSWSFTMGDVVLYFTNNGPFLVNCKMVSSYFTNWNIRCWLHRKLLCNLFLGTDLKQGRIVHKKIRTLYPTLAALRSGEILS